MKLVDRLSLEFGSSPDQLRRIIATAPARYAHFTIDKRNGDKRLIAQPAAELKALQRILVRRVLNRLPVHPAAFAYVKDKNIRANAAMHCRSEHILKLDFTNFFNSLVPVNLERVLRRHNDLIGVSPVDFEDLYRLVFWGIKSTIPRCLSVGAPSSPFLSNALMYDVDTYLTDVAVNLGVVYTRYADDITASCVGDRGKLIAFERQVLPAVAASQLSLSLNEDKRGIYGRGDRRMVTGLIITPNGEISVGRDRKREIRSLVHRISQGQRDPKSLMRTKGLLAFLVSAEPTYLASLSKSYGPELLREIFTMENITFYGSIVDEIWDSVDLK